jgi:hypothetical protein
MSLPDAPVPTEGFFVTHFLTVSDQARSRDFYTRILGGTVLTDADPCVITLANSWIMVDRFGRRQP